MARFVVVIKNVNVISIDVLLPWSFLAICKDAGNIHFDIMVQIILPKVMLSLFTKSSKYRLVQLIWKEYFCEVDYIIQIYY